MLQLLSSSRMIAAFRARIFMALATVCLFGAALPAWAQDDAMMPPPGAGMESMPTPSPDEDEDQNQTQKPDPGSRLSRDATIQYDSESGQIVVIADEETNQYIQQVIERLDQPIPQVLIKVLFLEVTHAKNLDLGVQGGYKGVNGDRTQSILSAFGLATESNGGIYELLDTNVEVLVRALAETNKLEVLSRPSVMARNNQQATITVGQTIPFITNSRVTDEGQTINTIEYDDVGIILNVTPHITPDKMVEMDVSPEISKLTSQTVPISDTADAYVIDTRSADTRVVVQDGKTVVIGGMMEDAKTENVKKIPLLGDIPGLGILFRRTVSENVKTELLIFLTPYVVEYPAQVRKLSQDEKNRAETIDDSFTKKQLNKFIDNLDDKHEKQATVTYDKPGKKANAAAQKPGKKANVNAKK